MTDDSTKELIRGLLSAAGQQQKGTEWIQTAIKKAGYVTKGDRLTVADRIKFEESIMCIFLESMRKNGIEDMHCNAILQEVGQKARIEYGR